MHGQVRQPPRNRKELEKHPRWVVYKKVEKPNGKIDKVPLLARDLSPRWGQQAGWLIASEAALWAKKHGLVDDQGRPQIGFVFTNDGLCGADIDDNPESLAAMLKLTGPTWFETSPSGRGYHFLVTAAPDELDRINDTRPKGPFGEFEFYRKGRFFTFTGDDYLAPTESFARISPELLKIVTRARAREATSATTVGYSNEDLRAILAKFTGEYGYETWCLLFGMAVHHETFGSEEGFRIWHDWSAERSGYVSEEDCRQHWDSFGQGAGPQTTMRSVIDFGKVHEPPVSVGGPTVDDSKFKDLGGGEEEPAPEPKYDTVKDKEGEQHRRVCTLKNLVTACLTGLAGVELKVDSFLNRVMVDGKPIADEDLVAMRVTLGERNFKGEPRKELMRDAALLAARVNTYDSAQDWLLGLPAWDGVSRIARYMPDFWSTKDGAYERALGVYIWTGLAGRVMDPGCKADMALIFVGPQGCGKTRGVEAMSPREEWCGAINFHRKDEDLARTICGRLVMEMSELAGLRRRDMPQVKEFISKRIEAWVPKYVENEKSYLRRCLLFGTTNDVGFLDDETGERRFLPVEVGTVDVDGIATMRDQLWAEGLELWRANGVMWQEAEALAPAVHAQFAAQDAWRDSIAAWISESEEVRAREVLGLHEILLECFGKRAPNRGDEERVTKALVKLGFAVTNTFHRLKTEAGVKANGGKPVKRGFKIPIL